MVYGQKFSIVYVCDRGITQINNFPKKSSCILMI